MYSLSEILSQVWQFCIFLSPVSVGCPHVDQCPVPQCGHLDIILNHNKHLAIPPAPGLSPGRHDAHVGVRDDDSLGAVTESEVPGHIPNQVSVPPAAPVYPDLESDLPAGLILREVIVSSLQ